MRVTSEMTMMMTMTTRTTPNSSRQESIQTDSKRSTLVGLCILIRIVLSQILPFIVIFIHRQNGSNSIIINKEKTKY